MRHLITILCGAVVIVATGALGWLVGLSSQPKPYGPPREYKLYVGDKPVGSFRGQEIRSNGFCLEVVLNGRIDTLVCGQSTITEAQATTGVPDAQVVPTGTEELR